VMGITKDFVRLPRMTSENEQAGDVGS